MMTKPVKAKTIETKPAWVRPELVRLGRIADVSATQNNLVQTGNSKS